MTGWGSERPSPRWKWLMAILTMSVVTGLVITGFQRFTEYQTAASTARPATPLPAVTPAPTAPGSTPARTPTPTPSTPPSTPLRVVGLGDSVAAGINCECHDDDYVKRFGRLLSRAVSRPVEVSNLSLGGAQSGDLLDDWDTRLRAPVAAADVVVITVGANDLTDALETWRDTGTCGRRCWGSEVEDMGDRVDRLVRRIAGTQPGARPEILLTGYWNVFSDGKGSEDEAKGYRAWSRGLTRAVNERLRESAEVGDAEFVDLYPLFNGSKGQADPTDLLAVDGDHPNAAGLAVISDAVLAAYLRRPS